MIALVYDPQRLAERRVRSRLRGADVLVLPELMDGGYAALRKNGAPHVPGSPLLQQLRALSRDAVPVCVAGSVAYRAGTRRPTNTTLVFIGGRLAARYDKIHLFPPAREPRYFQRGHRLSLFPLHGIRPQLRAGLMLCFDLRFPELARALAAGGAGLMIVPARWPAAREDAWRTLLKARAIENQCFVIGCNARGVEGGRSFAFDPLGGEIFASRRDGSPGADRVILDPARLNAARSLYRWKREAKLSRLPTGPSRFSAFRRRTGQYK